MTLNAEAQAFGRIKGSNAAHSPVLGIDDI
jgi:hypothetical protein